MTRINAGIPYINMVSQHLRAELKEITNVKYCVRKRIEKGTHTKVNIPEKFTLGTGHVTFFFNKLGYLSKRYNELKDEWFLRTGKHWNNDVEYLTEEELQTHPEFHYFMGDYAPGQYDIDILVPRMCQQIDKFKTVPRYGDIIITKDEAKDMLLELVE